MEDMQEEAGISALIDDIYAAALTTDDPSPLLGRLAKFLGFEAVGLVTARSQYTEPTCNAAWGLDLALCQRMEEQFAVSLSVVKLRGHEIQAGEFGFRDEFISDAEFRSHPFFHEFVLPHRLQDGLKVCLENSAERMIFVNFARPVPGADRERQRRLVAILAPHWVRATQVFIKLGQFELFRRAYEEAANLSPLPVVVFDNTGSLFFANARATRLLEARDGLALCHGTLHATADAENQRLRQLVRQAAIRPDTAQGALPSLDIVVKRPSGKRPYQLVVIPLSPGRPCEGRRPAAMVVIVDPEAEFEVSAKRCSELFGFTRAEAQVALGVMRGRSVEEIAAMLGNSIATSRNLLKRVFLKTGVSRQSELTRLLLSSSLFFADPALHGPPEEREVRHSAARMH